jgi:hypothetical protein
LTEIFRLKTICKAARKTIIFAKLGFLGVIVTHADMILKTKNILFVKKHEYI